MNAELKRGDVLVLQGPQGCGKTKMAYKIAAATGSFAVAGANDLSLPFGLDSVLRHEPDTLIVEGVTSVEDLKKWLVADTVVVRRKGRESKVVKTPNLIFCSPIEGPIPGIESNDRRFRVVELAT